MMKYEQNNFSELAFKDDAILEALKENVEGRTEMYEMNKITSTCKLNSIYNEDCIIGMSRIADKSIDMICCDLPYGALNKNNPNVKWDTVIPFDKLWEQYERIIKDDGAIVLFGQGKFSAKLILSNEKLYRYTIIWEKDRPTGFLNAKKMPLRSHEDIMVFYKKNGTYNPQMVYAPERRNHSRGSGKHRNTNQCYGEVSQLEDTIISDFKYPRSIVKINKEHFCQGNEHPTQKPVELIEWLIKTYSNEGDVVLDNCMGCGTTAVACINTNRKYIGFEIEEKYYDMALNRVNNIEPSLWSYDENCIELNKKIA